jgi:hypothetical protein
MREWGMGGHDANFGWDFGRNKPGENNMVKRREMEVEALRSKKWAGEGDRVTGRITVTWDATRHANEILLQECFGRRP